jgi:hypothetical protein
MAPCSCCLVLDPISFTGRARCLGFFSVCRSHGGAGMRFPLPSERSLRVDWRMPPCLFLCTATPGLVRGMREEYQITGAARCPFRPVTSWLMRAMATMKAHCFTGQNSRVVNTLITPRPGSPWAHQRKEESIQARLKCTNKPAENFEKLQPATNHDTDSRGDHRAQGWILKPAGRCLATWVRCRPNASKPLHPTISSKVM